MKFSATACRSLIIASLLTVAAYAGEPYYPFLEGLYDRGYGAAALDYIKFSAARTDLDPEIRVCVDLDTATALRVAARETQNTDESAAYLASAQTHLDKFLKEHPDHPKAATAMITYGDLAAGRGEKLLEEALGHKGPEPSPLYAEARAALEAARGRYVSGIKRLAEQHQKLVAQAAAAAEQPGAAKPRLRAANRPEKATPLELAEEAWLEARFKLALLDYNVGRTYTDVKSPDRKKALQSAAAEFDAIYQPNRVLRAGLVAHMWHGRVVEELGDLLTATDIYDEVLANAPSRGEHIDPKFEALFAEVEGFRLSILLKQGQVDEAMQEAEEWLEEYKLQRRTSGYQAIALQLAKCQLASLDKAPEDRRRKLLLSAVSLLTEASKVPGPQQREATLLRLEHGSKGSAEVKTLDEALVVADNAAAQEKWADAIAGYEKAIALAAESKDAKNADKLAAARFQLARSQLMSGKIAEALAAAEALAQERASVNLDKIGPLAGALAVDCAWNLYVASQGKPEALDKLKAAADFAIRTWPERSEADDARIALGKVELVRGDFPLAIGVFEKVNKNSDRYPLALYLAAQTHFRLYLQEKAKPADKQNAAAAAEHRTKTVEELVAAVAAERKAAPASAPLPKSLLDSSLFLAEVYLEGGDATAAVPYLDPIVAAMQAHKPKALDAITLRSCIDAVRAYMSVKDLAKAEGVATLLVELGEDTPQVNRVLIEFLRNVKFEWKKAEADVISSGSDSAAHEAATKAAASNKELLSKLLTKLAARKELDLAAMIFIADSASDAGLSQQARDTYQVVLERSKDPAFLGKNASALTRVRAQLIGLLRTEQKYAEALAQAEQLVKDNPTSLDALMEKGRILQSWAEQDASKLQPAVAHWTELRLLLQRMRKRPPDYYEVVYNVALCLVLEAETGMDKATKANQAEQLLKSALILSPKLNGPDTVARYKVLIDKAIALQGRSTKARQ